MDDASATVATLSDLLRRHAYADGLAREWRFITGPGGRRYRELAPEFRAQVDAVYQERLASLGGASLPAPEPPMSGGAALVPPETDELPDDEE